MADMEGMTSDQLQRATYKYVKATSERTERIEKTTEATLELAQKIATQEKYQERRPLLEGVVKEIPDEPAKGLTAAAVRDLKSPEGKAEQRRAAASSVEQRRAVSSSVELRRAASSCVE
jgi:hypothetical protein